MPQHRQDSSTKQLLQQVVEQLAVQTEELKHIRRSSSVTNQLLSGIHNIVQQLLQLVHSISTSCRSLADAASSHLASIAAAQQAAHLQAILSSGRLVMLLTMSLLALLNIRSSFSRTCLAGNPAWTAVLNKAVPGWAAAVLGGVKKAGKQQSPGGLLWNLAAPGRSGRCLMSFAGQYSSGTVILLTWTSWAWKQQQRQQGSSASAPAAVSCSHTPASILHAQQHTQLTWSGLRDPFMTLLLARFPENAVQTNSSNNSSSGSSSSGSGSGSGTRGCVSNWASLLQAGLYEGTLGCTAVRLLGGRWGCWLLLWEGWLIWLPWQLLLSVTSSDTSTTSSSRGQSSSSSSSSRVQCSSGVQGSSDSGKAVQRTACGVAVGGSTAQADCSLPQATKQGIPWLDHLPLPHKQAGSCCDNGNSSSSTGVSSSSSKLHPVVWLLGLALMHVGLPVLLAAAGLWRG